MLSQPASVRIKHKFLYIKDLCDLGVLCGEESRLTTCRGIGALLCLPRILSKAANVVNQRLARQRQYAGLILLDRFSRIETH